MDLMALDDTALLLTDPEPPGKRKLVFGFWKNEIMPQAYRRYSLLTTHCSAGYELSVNPLAFFTGMEYSILALRREEC